MHTTPHPDFVVAGAGVIGASIAYHLARSGASVLIADPGSPLRPSASWASAGGIRRQNRDPREWALAVDAHARWPALAEELDADLDFQAGGHLHVAEDAVTLETLADRAGRETAAGLDVRVVDAAAARELAPLLARSVLGGTYTYGDGQANPRLVTRAFQAAATRLGA
ncbi:MAG: FAD-dependent oxidoreductase, partial [Chloroflexota bacterium]